MQCEILTGLSHGQLAGLAARATGRLGGVVRQGGAPAVAGLFRSVAMVVTLIGENFTGRSDIPAGDAGLGMLANLGHVPA